MTSIDKETDRYQRDLAKLLSLRVVSHGGKRWPKCWHKLRTETHGANRYWECEKCGRRSVRSAGSRVMGPANLKWVYGETDQIKSQRPTRPPPRGKP